MTITTQPMTTIDFADLGLRVDDEGLASVVASLRPQGPQLATHARCVGVELASIDLLESAAASDVLWLRAYIAVHADLAARRPVFGLVA